MEEFSLPEGFRYGSLGVEAFRSAPAQASSREPFKTRVWGRAHVPDNSIDVTAAGLKDKLLKDKLEGPEPTSEA